MKKSIKFVIDFGIDFWLILDRFWKDFGSQNPSKIDQKMKQKNRYFLDRFWIDFSSIWGAKMGGPGGVLKFTFWCLFGSWGHLGAKMAPRPLQEASGTDFGWFLDRFWLIFEWILLDFWCDSQWFLDRFGAKFASTHHSINQSALLPKARGREGRRQLDKIYIKLIKPI